MFLFFLIFAVLFVCWCGFLVFLCAWCFRASGIVVFFLAFRRVVVCVDGLACWCLSVGCWMRLAFFGVLASVFWDVCFMVGFAVCVFGFFIDVFADVWCGCGCFRLVGLFGGGGVVSWGGFCCCCSLCYWMCAFCFVLGFGLGFVRVVVCWVLCFGCCVDVGLWGLLFGWWSWWLAWSVFRGGSFAVVG